MRFQPRQQILDIWRATARYSVDDQSKNWIWSGRSGSNSIADAEQLLCILLPATELGRFRLDKPDETDRELLASLKPLGDALEVPQLLARAIIAYLERYSDGQGKPVFSGGSYFSAVNQIDEPTKEQMALDVVESYASSIILMLAALGFSKVFRGVVSRDELRSELERLDRLAKLRLSAAMVGLLRSFAINVFPVESKYGEALLRMVNQTNQPTRKLVTGLQFALRDIAAGLRDLNVGVKGASDLDNPERLFECGWSWGITSNAPVVEIAEQPPPSEQLPGHAPELPYLYFTVVALDAIVELHSERTRLLGLLDENQLRLSDALRIRWDLTQRYWATIATYGDGRWPLEDIPWRTTDDVESDFLTLLVTSIAARELASSNTALNRLGDILAELANRGRIVRRPFDPDPALALHHPGFSTELDEIEQFGPRLAWVVSDHAPLLLKRVLRVTDLIDDIDGRARLLRLADNVWDHIRLRRIDEGTAQALWDQPADAFPAITERYSEPSWHHTLRVVESLVIAGRVIEKAPLYSNPLAADANHLLAEATHLYDQELFAGSAGSGKPMRERIESVGQMLRRAQEVVDVRPASAIALLHQVLRDLDGLAAARQDVQQGAF